MDKWIYKHSIETPSGIRLDEVKCPVCGYCETVPGYFRHRSCYVCENELEPDDVFCNQMRDFVLEGLEIIKKAEELC